MAFDELAAEGSGPFAEKVAVPVGCRQSVDAEVLTQRALQILSTQPRPFLKWAGSKQRLLRDIIPALPSSFDRYYEPFIGSGALFFLLRPERASLGDACTPLIEPRSTGEIRLGSGS